MTPEFDRIMTVLRHGLRNVSLPKAELVRVSLVIEYPQSTVRHEIVPEGTQVGHKYQNTPIPRR